MRKRFRIRKIRDGFYRVDQRHSILGISYWDSGAECLCPKYNFSTLKKAEKAILEKSVEYDEGSKEDKYVFEMADNAIEKYQKELDDLNEES